MSFAITALVLAGVGTGLSVHAQLTAGKQQEADMERAAEAERVAAEGEELQRQQKLNRALAANAVGLGMSGITAEGTPASIALSSAEDISLSEGSMKLSSRLKQAQMVRAGRNARSASKLAATGSLLQGASQISGGLGSLGGSGGGGTTEATGTYSSDWNYNG